MIVSLPPQVKIRCDVCEEDLGDGDGSYHVFDADDGRLDEIALDYDWQIRDGKHVCVTCLEEMRLKLVPALSYPPAARNLPYPNRSATVTDQVDQLRGQVEVLRLALSDSERRYEEMHGLMTRAFELRRLTAARLAYLVEACSMSVPMDNYHPDVLVFNEDPTRLLREALVLAVNDLEGTSPVPEEQP